MDFLSNVVAKQKKLWSELNALDKESFTYYKKKKSVFCSVFLNSYFLAFFFFGSTPIYRTFFFFIIFSLVCYAVRE